MIEPHPLQTRIRRLLRHPVAEIGLIVLILCSVLLLLLERFVSAEVEPWVVGVGEGLIWLFRVELAVRILTSSRPARTTRRYLLDLIAVAPLPEALRGLRVLRALRLLRAGAIIARSLRWRDTTRVTISQIANLSAVSLILVVVAAALLPDTDPELLGSYDEALWYSLLSLVAGEPIGADPTSDGGRLVTLMLMVGGLTVFGVFIGTVSGSVAASLGAGLGLEDAEMDELRGHVIVLGWNRSAPVLLSELLRARELVGRDIVLVTEGPRPPSMIAEGMEAARLHHLEGDWTSLTVLKQAGVEQASHAIILTDETITRSDHDRDARTVLAALLIERTAGGPDRNVIHTVAEVTSTDVTPILKQAGVEAIVRGDWYAGVIMGSAARNPRIVPILDELLSTRHGSALYTVTLDASWSGRTAGELYRVLYESQQASLIALHEPTGDRVNPPCDARITAPAEAVVLAPKPPGPVHPPADAATSRTR